MSDNDELLTREIMNVSEYLNIKMLDHIIICKDRNVSCFNEIRIKDITIDDGYRLVLVSEIMRIMN